MHLKKTAFSPYVCITQVTSGWSDFSSMFADGSKQKALTDTDESTGLTSENKAKYVR